MSRRPPYRCRHCSEPLPNADAGCPACGATGPHPRAPQPAGAPPTSRRGARLRVLVAPTLLVLLVAGLLFAVLVFLFAVLDVSGGPGAASG